MVMVHFNSPNEQENPAELIDNGNSCSLDITFIRLQSFLTIALFLLKLNLHGRRSS